jgi:purine-binding chemotaxis protein CheW
VKGPTRRLFGAEARAAQAEDALQLVAFHAGGGEYALDIMRIKEIVNPVRITPVPKAPSFVEGVIELRGAILPIIDLRKRFELHVAPPSRTTKFIITGVDVGGKRMIVGLVVDGVSEPMRVARADVRPAPALAHGDAAYFVGVVRRIVPGAEDRIVMIIDIDALLSAREKSSLAGLDEGSA